MPWRPEPPSTAASWWACCRDRCCEPRRRSAGGRSTWGRVGPWRPGSRSGRGGESGGGGGAGLGRLGIERRATGEGPLAADAAALPLAQPAPDAELLAVGEGVLEAVLPHDA